MSTLQKYPWLKVLLGYGLLCPAIAGFLFLLSNIIDAQTTSGLGFFAARLPTEKFNFSALGALIMTPLFSLGSVAMFGLPFLIFSLFFVGFKVHKGMLAYCFAAGWGVFLGLFLLTFSSHTYHVPGDVHFALMAAISLALAALLVTYWVVPPEATDAAK